MTPPVTLVPFTGELLPAVQPWFLHPEVRRRLGGPGWPARVLRAPQPAPGEEYRGQRVLRVHSWVALDLTGAPVALVGGDVYDRWSRYDGSRADHPVVTAVEAGPAMGLAFVVAPDRWREGFCAATLRAVVAHRDVQDVRLFAAGVDVDNAASQACAAAARFRAGRHGAGLGGHGVLPAATQPVVRPPRAPPPGSS